MQFLSCEKSSVDHILNVLCWPKGGGNLSCAMRDEGWNHTQWSPKWMKLGLLDQFFVLKKMKIVSDTTDSFWGQKWPIFAPKTAILANFGIDKGVLYFFNIQNGWNLAYFINFSGRQRKKQFRTLLTHFGAENGPFLPQKLRFWLILG